MCPLALHFYVLVGKATSKLLPTGVLPTAPSISVIKNCEGSCFEGWNKRLWERVREGGSRDRQGAGLPADAKAAEIVEPLALNQGKDQETKIFIRQSRSTGSGETR